MIAVPLNDAVTMSPPVEAAQQQFLEVIDRDEAERRFHAHLDLRPLGTEVVALADALGRVLGEDVQAAVDVPGFDRSNVDGFAVQAADTYGAAEETPRLLDLNPEVLATGVAPDLEVKPGTATPIATGAIIPRGADAVVMIEHTDVEPSANRIRVTRPVTPGANLTFAGTDVARGELVLRRGGRLTSRETGVLAAIGVDRVSVYRRPRVAILSTGNEIIAPGEPMRPGAVYDSNATILADSVRELGGEAVLFGVVPDELDRLREAVARALDCDVVVLSGGTSKGEGDVSYRVVRDLPAPGIVAHGVALKPGKPLCLAVAGKTPVVILPGFPTSAIFTFHEFVAPVIRAFAGLSEEDRATVEATVPMRLNSERGRTEYVLVSLVEDAGGLVAYPLGKGSGSVTTFSRADGFVTVDRHHEIVEAGTRVRVALLSPRLERADLVAIGSHCVGLDYLLGVLEDRGFRTKCLTVGSTAGLRAAERGECDIAGIHLLDPESGVYNRPFVKEGLELVPGYRRMQGIVFRNGDERFEAREADDAVRTALADPSCRMVNRNAGSGTRILIDRFLDGQQPPGYAVQAKTHNAVAASVAQGRADWGVAIESVARSAGLGFLPLSEEHYDFLVGKGRGDRPAVKALREVLLSDDVCKKLRGFCLEVSPR
jgi:putative molybdopterin biosynthesis protein